jgi:hypothetical protein
MLSALVRGEQPAESAATENDLVTVLLEGLELIAEASAQQPSLTPPAAPAITDINDAPTGAVTLSGTPTQGQILTASNTLTDLDGIPSSGVGAIRYQWKADGNEIAGATGSTYQLTQAEVGKIITVTASYIDNYGTAEIV